MGGQKENFSRVAGQLRHHYRVIVPDLPGFGGSTRIADADYRIDAQTDRIIAFADALGLQRLHLGGNSMGGFIAAVCAGRHPDRVGSLWLIGPAGLHGPEETSIVREFKAGGEWPLLLRKPADLDRLLHAVTVHPPFMPAAVKLALGMRGVSDYPLHRRIAQQGLLQSPPLDERYRSLATLALIVWGGEDQVLHPSAGAAFTRLLPNSELRVMPGVGHAAMMEAPQPCAADYLRFRERVDQPASLRISANKSALPSNPMPGSSGSVT